MTGRRPRKQNRPFRMSILERALIEKHWHDSAVRRAEIYAVMSDDSRAMVDAAGKLLYVVMGACMAEDVDEDDDFVTAMRNAVDAVHDQAGEPEIPAERRTVILRGLEACADVLPALPRKALVDAACTLAMLLRRGHLMREDFPGTQRAPS